MSVSTIALRAAWQAQEQAEAASMRASARKRIGQIEAEGADWKQVSQLTGQRHKQAVAALRADLQQHVERWRESLREGGRDEATVERLVAEYKYAFEVGILDLTLGQGREGQ